MSSPPHLAPQPHERESSASKTNVENTHQVCSWGTPRDTITFCPENSATPLKLSDHALLGTTNAIPPPWGCLTEQKVKVDKQRERMTCLDTFYLQWKSALSKRAMGKHDLAAEIKAQAPAVQSVFGPSAKVGVFSLRNRQRRGYPSDPRLRLPLGEKTFAWKETNFPSIFNALSCFKNNKRNTGKKEQQCGLIKL